MQLPKQLTTVSAFSKYLAMVLFILFPFLGFYLGMQYQKSISFYPQLPKQQKQNTAYSSPKNDPQIPTQYAITPTIFPSSPSTSLYQPSYLKRQYATTNTFSLFGHDVPLPNEITNVTDADAVALRCTRYFFGWTPPNYYDDESPSFKLTDQNLLNILMQANKTVPNKTIHGARFCQTEDQRMIVSYNVNPGISGGGQGNDTYFGQLNNVGSVKQLASIPIERLAYFTCTTPLLLTKQNILYEECGSEASASVYKINLDTGITNRLLFCVEHMAMSDTEDLSQFTLLPAKNSNQDTLYCK